MPTSGMVRNTRFGRGIGCLVAGLVLCGIAGCSGESDGLSPAQVERSAAQVKEAHAAAKSEPVTKLLVFIEENHSLDQMRIDMPYTFQLAEEFSHATNYTAITHPSLPNYLAIATGKTWGITDDKDPAAHPIRGRSVFGQAVARGRTAKVYADGMPSNCALQNGGEDYAVRHNPWAYMVNERVGCEKFSVPLHRMARDIENGQLPNIGMVIPNTCHDAHSCSLAQADAWFQARMAKIFAGKDWLSGRLAVVLTADEDDRSQGNKVLTVVVHPSQRGTIVTEPLTHYSLTGLFSDVVHAPDLGKAEAAPSMSRAFGLPIAPK
jgi:phosphatidylinositol-3-phosphatase